MFTALGIRQVEVGSFDDLSGGYCFSRSPGPLAMVVKAGGLGNETFFEYAIERMKRSEQGEENVT